MSTRRASPRRRKISQAAMACTVYQAHVVGEERASGAQ